MKDRDVSGVRTPPPLVYLGCILIGAGLEQLWPVTFLPPAFRSVAGTGLIISSFALFALVLREFSRSSTSIDHSRETTEILSSGPFGYSRNPVYLSLTMLILGIAIAAESIWILAMTIPAVLIIHKFVILREEEYLDRKFGAEYARYRGSVRRWL